MLAQPLGHRGDARRELEALAARSGVAAAHPRHEHQHDEEEHELHEPGLGRVVEERAPGRGCRSTTAPTTARGNDTMPPIERGGQPAQQRVGPDVHEVGRVCVGGDEQDHRHGRRGTRRSPTPPVDTIFGLMPVMPGEVGVGRRRAHRVAERGVPEQPPEPDGDERHDDQDEQLARGHRRCRATGLPLAVERQRELRSAASRCGSRAARA